MNICLPNDSKQGIGGGWSFRRSFIKGLTHYHDAKYVENIEDADVCLIAGVTMVTRETIDRIINSRKKLVTRLDNVPRNSRNRNTGTSRLKEFSERADAVVWQCKWAKDYLGDFIKPKKEKIIYNAVDTEIFNAKGPRKDFGEGPVYFYSRFNRDETKNWEVAWYEYQMIQREDKNAKLVIVGKFSPEQLQYNFDFFRGENVTFLGVVEDPNEMATIMRGCHYFLATYYNDCYSNTYLEAVMCGMKLVKTNMSGGTPELLKNANRNNSFEFNGNKRMVGEFIEYFKTL